MTKPPESPRHALPEDAEATVPVAGWDKAATIPAAKPAPGSAINYDETIPADLNKNHDDHKALEKSSDRESSSANTAQTDVGSALTPQKNAKLGSAAQTVLTSHNNAQASTGAATHATASSEAATLVPDNAAVSNGPLTDGYSKSVGSSRSFTRTGRTRVNLNLPAEARQLDQKLQMSRTSVLSDMATARIARGDASELPPGIKKLIDQQGTEGRYAVDRPLAAGGMGAVLKIDDHDFRRPAAMKVILSRFTKSTEATERFLAEAQVTAQLEHPNIVPIHDLGVMDDGTLYFTMKLIEGMSLGRVIKLLQQQAGTLKDKDGNEIAADKESAIAEKKWTEEEKILTFLKVLDGVGFAHSRGVVHRDIKPDNIMLGAHGEVLVVDWGIAKVLGVADENNELVQRVASVRDQQSLSATMHGSAMGTLFYMPPEQALGKLDEVDARSDIYALGAMLYELLCLRRYIEGGTTADLVARIANNNYIPLDRVAAHLSPDLIAIVHRSLALERADRYASCDEFAADLRRYLAGQAVLARQRNFLERIGEWYGKHRRQVQVSIAGVLLVIGAVIGTTFYQAHQRQFHTQSLRVEAQQLFAEGQKTGDLRLLDQARIKTVEAAALLSESTTLALKDKIEEALHSAQAAEQTRLEQIAAHERAQKLFLQAQDLHSKGELADAEKILDAALRLAPDQVAISNLLKQVVGERRDERLAQVKKAAFQQRQLGDNLLTQAQALPLADPHIDALLRQADEAFAKAESEVPVDGTQAQVKKVALLRNEAELARRAQAHHQQGMAAAQRAEQALAAGAYEPAKEAIAQALGFLPSEPSFTVLRDRILAAERQARAQQTQQQQQRQADHLAQQAQAALTAGDIKAASDFAAQAWGLVPGHQQTETIRAQIVAAQQQQAAHQRKVAARQQADLALAEAQQQLQALQAGVTRLSAANAVVQQLSYDLAGQPSTAKEQLWQAHREQQAARTAVSEHWSLTEAAAQNVLGFLADDPEQPQIQIARDLLADLYQARLTDARQRRDFANVAAFANLLARYDNGRYAALLQDLGQVQITGPAGLTIHMRPVAEGNDMRLVAQEPVSKITLPSPPVSLMGGRYQLIADEVMITIMVGAGKPLTVTWPHKLPTIPGMPLRYVPGFGKQKAFLLGQFEVTQQQYHAFITDKNVWPQVQESWRAYFSATDAATAPALTLIPRQPGDTIWQPAASDDLGIQLTGLTIPTGDENLPIWGISRDDAEAYCVCQSKKTGLRVRLPTMAEWQLAAHGNDDRRQYPWGEVFDDSFSTTAYGPHRVVRQRAEVVGAAPADVGPFGHHDLAGNVREWLQDRSGAHGAVVAGGGWSGDRADQFRTTFIESAQPLYTGPVIGFRILVELP